MSDLRRLQYFLAVARERNFTRAAEQLHVAQPALSRQVRLLNALTERHTGLRLATEVKSVSEIVRGMADGSIDVGIVRCPPAAPDLESRVVRHEVQGALVHRDHRLAAHSSVALQDLAGEVLLMHPRDANPGHYDEIVELCRSAGFEPRVMLRRLTFDLAYSPVANGDAIAIIGASSRNGLPDGLCWRALEPPASLDVSLLARRYNRSPAVERMLGSAELIGRELGWI